MEVFNKYILVLVFLFIPLAIKNIKIGISGFIMVGMFPHLIDRAMFGIRGLNPMNIMFFTVILTYFVFRTRHKFSLSKRKLPIFKWLIIISIFQFIFVIRTWIWGGYYMDNVSALYHLFLNPLEYYIILFILFKSIKSEKDIKFFFYIFYFASLVGISILLWQYQTYDPHLTIMWRSQIAGHKNAFSILAGMILVISIIFFFYSKDRKIKLLCFFGGIASLLVLIYSLSRTSWIGFLGAIIYLIYKKRSGKVFIAIGLLTLVIAITPLADLVIHRVNELLVDVHDITQITGGRWDKKWSVQWKAIQNNPIVGGGPQAAFVGHIGYLTMWNSLTIFGLIATIIFFFKLYNGFLISYKRSLSISLHRIFSLSGLCVITMTLIINFATDFIPMNPLTIAPMSLIMFMYISSYKLMQWENEKYSLTPSNKAVS